MPLPKPQTSPAASVRFRDLAVRTLAILLCLMAWACGGPPPELERAQGQLRRGDLDGARQTLATLGELEGEGAQVLQSLREELAALQAGRDQLDRELLALHDLPFKEARTKLKALAESTGDPWGKNRIEEELSDLVDRAAADRSRLARSKEGSAQSATPATPAPGPSEEELAEQEQAKQRALDRMQAAVAEAAREQQRAPEVVDPEPTEEAARPGPTPEPVAAPESTVETPAEPAASPLPIELAPEVPEHLRQALAYFEYALEVAHPADRETAARDLLSIFPRKTYFLRRALRVRWDRAARALLDHPDRQQLEGLHGKLLALRAKRAEALELIFNRQEYFYPYKPGEVPQERARAYAVVQQRVENLVGELEALWQDPTSLVLSRELLGHVDELRWQRTWGADHGHFPSLPRGLQSWILWLGEPGEELTVRNFTTRRAGRVALAYDRAVEAHNRAHWADQDLLGEGVPGAASPREQAQVQITNEYRRMFGVPLLAWNPLLQEAARGHSEYMAKVRVVTHTQEGDPSRRSPFDRMALVGYNYGASENCSEGFVPPEAAHRSWQRSSAHHRNLLNPEYTELGAALAGLYWTQNFGSGRDFQSELNSWQD